jgi:hypothetical protein
MLGLPQYLNLTFNEKSCFPFGSEGSLRLFRHLHLLADERDLRLGRLHLVQLVRSPQTKTSFNVVFAFLLYS